MRSRALVAMILVSACAEGGTTRPQASALSPDGSARVPPFARAGAASSEPAPSSTAAASDPSAATSSSAEPTVAVPDVSAPPPAKPPEPLPDVEVKNVGMHIGGGPNDNETKRPIREAVKPHYDALRACYAKAVKPGKADTFGVDIRIPGEGGIAKISKPRTPMKGDGLLECMVAVFEKVEFTKPAKGVPMTVSFSVEFKRK
jgi:hypothetical protein